MTIVTVLLTSAAMPAAAGQVALGYDLYAASLPAARLDLTLELTSRGYRVASELRTLGVADMRVGWRAEQVSHGRMVDGAVQPRGYSNRGKWREEPRIAILDYGVDESVAVKVQPSAEADSRPPVKPAQRAGTVDFMSALVQLVVADSPRAACAGTRQIFDGRRRYDMTLTAQREENLPPQRVAAYDGKALRCVVAVERVAGFPADGDGFEIPEKLFLWLARDERSGLVLPVRLQASTAYGTAVIHLTRIAVDDSLQARRAD